MLRMVLILVTVINQNNMYSDEQKWWVYYQKSKKYMVLKKIPKFEFSTYVWEKWVPGNSKYVYVVLNLNRILKF